MAEDSRSEGYEVLAVHPDWRVLPSATRMKPEAALEQQIARYREMTGEQRLAVALGLHELACGVARAGIQQQFPQATEEEVERRLRQRLELARQL